MKQELPSHIKQSLEAYVGCIAGAVLIDEYRRLLEQAGFASVAITDTGADLNAYAMASDDGCCGQSSGCTQPSPTGSEAENHSLHAGLASVMQSIDANAYAASVRVHALKSPQTTNSTADPTMQCVTKEQAMKTIQVFDKPMCCPTGVCGPDVDPVLPRFAADLDWLKSQGHDVQRYNLAQQPQAFIDNQTIHQLLSTTGTNCLPVIIVDGEIFSQSSYPSREALAARMNDSTARHLLPVANPTGGCCGSTDCC